MALMLCICEFIYHSRDARRLSCLFDSRNERGFLGPRALGRAAGTAWRGGARLARRQQTRRRVRYARHVHAANDCLGISGVLSGSECQNQFGLDVYRLGGAVAFKDARGPRFSALGIHAVRALHKNTVGSRLGIRL